MNPPQIAVLEKSKLPDYINTILPLTWEEALRKPIPSKDTYQFVYYTVKLYELAINEISKGIKLTSNDQYIHLLQDKLDSIKEIRSCRFVEDVTKYNMKCESGKIGLSNVVFCTVCALNLIVLYSIGHRYRVSVDQFKAAIVWAREQKILTLDPKCHNTWTQMEVYTQIRALSSQWSMLKMGPEMYESFWFVSMLEDKVSSFIFEKHDESIIDGTIDSWVKPVTQNSKLKTVSLDYIDDVGNVFAAFDRSMFILQKVYSFKETVFPEEEFNKYRPLFRKWIQKSMETDVLADYLDDARSSSIYYCLREGENDTSLRKNNGVKIRSTKWMLHATTRPYLQITWLLQEHTFNKDGRPKKVYPKKWQYHFLKLNALLNVVGEFGVRFFESLYLQERNFWKVFSQKQVMKNVFITEVLGEQFVIFQDKIYKTECVEDALLLWVILMKKEKRCVFLEKGINIDLTPTIDSLLADWNSEYHNTNTTIVQDEDDTMDIVM